MAVNVATLTAKLVADTRGLKTGLGKATKDVKAFEKKTTGATGRAAGGFGMLKKAALGAGLAFGAAKVLSFAKDSINAFSNLEESVNAVNVMYGEAAQGINDLGTNSANQFGLSTRAVNEAAVSMGAFAEKIDEANPADAFGNILQRATDFASVMNLETSDALDKFRAGLAGESEPLRKFNVDVSAATITQVALAAGIIQTGEKMTEAQKVQARYLAIMQQTEKTAGDFANTSDGLAGSQKKLSAKWEEAQAVLGEALAPAMTELLQVGVDLIPVFTLVVGVVGDLVQEAGPLISLIGDAAALIGDWSESADSAGESGGFFNAAVGGLKDSLMKAVNPAGTLVGVFTDLKTEFFDNKDATENLGDAWDELDPSAFDGDMAALGLTIGKTTKATGNFWGTAKKAAVATGNFATSTKQVREEQLKLVNPVFRANSALAEYEEALAEANEAGGVSADELRDLAPLFGEMEAASGALTGENLLAYNRLIGNVGDDANALPGVIRTAYTEADAVGATAFPNLEGAIGRLNTLFDNRIDIRVEATLPTRNDFDSAVRDAISRARRNGNLGPMVE